MKLVAMKRLRYPRGPNGKEYNIGESFTALSERDAKALTLVRAAKADDAKPTAKPRAAPQAQQPQPSEDHPNLLSTAAMKAEDSSAVTPTETQPEPRRYRRRDLQAQE